jgi:hypothetical protein
VANSEADVSATVKPYGQTLIAFLDVFANFVPRFPEKEMCQFARAMADQYFRKNRKLAIAVTRTDLLDLA